MNIARAKRRWAAWHRWADQVIQLCGSDHRAIPGQNDTYNELAIYYNGRGMGRRGRGRRCNRRGGLGWR